MKEDTENLKDFILECLKGKKATQIECMELNVAVPFADYMIFASGRSVKNIRAIAEHVTLQLKHEMNLNANFEGAEGSDWVLIDAGDVVVHLFHPETREQLKLEALWKRRNSDASSGSDG
ncbi:MAG: ribosome silencing factor [Rickettsiales bacterium]|nr:MAG: ribosome silencing factor [Rickettsiales bacterium]